MINFYRFSAAAYIGALAFLPVIAQQKVVTISEAGTMPELLSTEKSAITDLKVVGLINGTDLKLLRWMTGIDEYWKPTVGKLVNIDLSEAKMVEGGEPFTTAYNSDPAAPIWIYARENTMPEELFSDSNLESIIFPVSVTAIRSSLSDAHQVKGTVVVPEGVLYIGEWAFAGCGMEEIVLPSTLSTKPTSTGWGSLNFEALGNHAFDGCANLKKINIPSGVTYLNGSTFAGCSSLETLIIPENIERIGSECFNNSGIKNLIVDTDFVPNAQYKAFNGMDYDTVVVHIREGMEEKFRAAEEWEYFKNYVEDAGELTGGNSAVSIIEDKKDCVNIFSINGTLIESDMESLPAGIFIIDGKKVIKK